MSSPLFISVFSFPAVLSLLLFCLTLGGAAISLAPSKVMPFRLKHSLSHITSHFIVCQMSEDIITFVMFFEKWYDTFHYSIKTAM